MITVDLKTKLKHLFTYAGYEVRKVENALSEEAVLRHLLGAKNPAAVLDVGANAGQYAQLLRKLGYRETIVSFEAQPGVHAALQQTAVKDAGWIIAPCAAVGSGTGEVEIHISQNSVSSSVLPMRSTHLEAAPESIYVDTNKVRMERLDVLAKGLIPPSGELMLKVDTQGYEREVINGATGLLDRISLLQVELSLVALYEGAPTFIEMVSSIEQLGYELFSMVPAFNDRNTGRLLQVDGFFISTKTATH